VFARRQTIVAAALAVGLVVAGCGHKTGHESVADANNDGGYVNAGPVTYQLQISRELNQYSTEDSSYLRGLPAGTNVDLGQTGLWYGVFLWAKNQTGQVQTTSDNFQIVDTQGAVYSPIKLNTALNPFGWTPQSLPPLQTEPGPDTVASGGPTQGGLLLFKLNTSAYSNRPLTLYILSPAGKRLGSISLNL
jgi:hypothetical protein